MHEYSRRGYSRRGYSPGGNSRELRTSPCKLKYSTPRRKLMATKGNSEKKGGRWKRGKEAKESLPMKTETRHDSTPLTPTESQPVPKPSKKRTFSLGRSSKKQKKSHSSSSQSSMTADGTRSSPELHSPLTDSASPYTHAESSFALSEEQLSSEPREEEEEVFRSKQQVMQVEQVHAVYFPQSLHTHVFWHSFKVGFNGLSQ